jgi:deoxycytidine triphosphate deaminase
MGLKPDHWIRKMALEHGMIEPFVEKQVREGVISYGLSSYGYDLRVADEFLVFTNVMNEVVDPKNFKSESMVNYKGDVCIVPPNSFALARSVEYFRIPRSVLTVTVGKSTYARCFSGDTRVALVDGTSPTLEEMAVRAADGELFWGYSVGPHGRIVVTMLDHPRFVGRDSLLEITLDNGRVVRATPDHEFIRRDGRRAQAHELRPDDALMPLYRQVARGYEMIYQPINGHVYPTHRLADEWNLRMGMYEEMQNWHRHHKDFNRLNNNPWNIVRMDASAHIRLHNEHTFKSDDFDPEGHGLAVQEAIARRLKNDPEWMQMFSESQRKKALGFWHSDEHADARRELIQKRLESWTDERREAQCQQMLQHYSENPESLEQKSRQSKAMWARASEERRQQQREIARRIKIREEITAESVRQALDQAGSIRGAARILDCDRSVFRRFPEVIAAFKGQGNKPKRNHRITAIRDISGDHDVYCLTVPEAGNFALDAGIFVSNCGVITNVTPFEPGWEGHVTLEISNTTPLPAKIYANEGLAQVVFFEADEECEVSYADRKGKYQGQTGVTPPRL